MLPDAPVTSREFQAFEGRLFEYLEEQATRMERQFDTVDAHFDRMNGRFDEVCTRLDVLVTRHRAITAALARIAGQSEQRIDASD